MIFLKRAIKLSVDNLINITEGTVRFVMMISKCLYNKGRGVLGCVSKCYSMFIRSLLFATAHVFSVTALFNEACWNVIETEGSCCSYGGRPVLWLIWWLTCCCGDTCGSWIEGNWGAIAWTACCMAKRVESCCWSCIWKFWSVLFYLVREAYCCWSWLWSVSNYDAIESTCEFKLDTWSSITNCDAAISWLPSSARLMISSICVLNAKYQEKSWEILSLLLLLANILVTWEV